jgi:hypothetical protein
VDFVSVVGMSSTVETMKVGGEKILRTEKKSTCGPTSYGSSKETQPTKAPTLRRPGEEGPSPEPDTGPKPPAKVPDTRTSPPPQFAAATSAE